MTPVGNVWVVLKEKFTGIIANEDRLRKEIERVGVEALKRASPELLKNEGMIKFSVEKLSVHGEEVFKTVLKVCGEKALKYADPKILNNEEFMKFVLANYGIKALGHATSDLRDREEFIKFALKEYGKKHLNMQAQGSEMI